ncbi:MAG: DNA-binding protein [Deltaproteobacteria bacterium]|nr:MAG: DNA-binding protein [Deltaproteobacteria bacterium]
MDRVFLDANVLFSAAYRSGAGITRLWELVDVELLTSAYAAEGARRNLDRDEQRRLLNELLAGLQLVPESLAQLQWAQSLVTEKDAPILAAAMGAKANVLVTGDIRHFGPLMGRSDLPLRISTPRGFLSDRS